MNPYKNKKIKSSKDIRALDLFIKYNPSNDWVALEDVVCFAFETNSPMPWNQEAIHSFLYEVSASEFSRNPHALLEWSSSVVEGEHRYRLLNPSLINRTQSSVYSIEDEMYSVVQHHEKNVIAEERSIVEADQRSIKQKDVAEPDTSWLDPTR